MTRLLALTGLLAHLDLLDDDLLYDLRHDLLDGADRLDGHLVQG